MEYDFSNILEEIIINGKINYSKYKKLNNSLELRFRDDCHSYFFGITYSSNNNYGDFWNDIIYSKPNKEILIFNTHREVLIEHEGIGSLLLNTIESNFKKLSNNLDLKTTMHFIDIKDQKSTMKFLKKFGYSFGKLDDEKIMYKTLNK